MARNVREDFNSALHHGGQVLIIQRLLHRFLNIRQRSLIEGIEIHGLDVLRVHPAQLLHIENRRRLGNTAIVELLHQLLQAHDLLVVLGTPAQQCYEVHHSLGHKALLNEILEGGMAGALAQLLVILIGDQRTMYVLRYLPAEGLIETVVLRAGGQVLVAAHHMGNAHQVVIDNIGKVVRRIAVRLDQHHIIELCVVHGHITVELVMEGGGSLGGVVLANDIGHAAVQLLLHLLR